MNLEGYAKLIDYCSIEKGSCVGVATVELGGKVQIRMKAVMSKKGNLFVNMPTEGMEVNGSFEFVPMIKFVNEKFERELCEYVRDLIKDKVESPKEEELYEEELYEEELPF